MTAGRKKKLNDQEVLALKQKGLTNQEIADHFDVSLSTVRITLKKFKGEYDAHKNIGRNMSVKKSLDGIVYNSTMNSIGAGDYCRR